MDFGSSHVYEYEDSEEEYISDEELKVGMFLRYGPYKVGSIGLMNLCWQ